MTKNTIQSIKKGKLIGKHLANKASEAESRDLENWLNDNPRNKELLDEIRKDGNLEAEIDSIDAYDEKAAWQRLLELLERKKQIRILIRWKVAAIIFLIVGIGGVASNFIGPAEEEVIPQNFLTTIQTRRGESSKVILPDSSVVHLNSSTSLTYSNNFYADNRTVDLRGEAYFEVAKSATHPFEVSYDAVKVKVYGTSFNVNTATFDNTMDVVLEEGSVELSHNNNRFENVMLVPGEKASFDEANNVLRISKVDTYKYTAWREGLLVFEDDSMDRVFKKLEGWYDVDIEITDEKINEFVFNATIMDESLEDIFDLIQFSCGIKYNIIYSKNPKIISKVIVSLN